MFFFLLLHHQAWQEGLLPRGAETQCTVRMGRLGRCRFSDRRPMNTDTLLLRTHFVVKYPFAGYTKFMFMAGRSIHRAGPWARTVKIASHHRRFWRAPKAHCKAANLNLRVPLWDRPTTDDIKLLLHHHRLYDPVWTEVQVAIKQSKVCQPPQYLGKGRFWEQCPQWKPPDNFWVGQIREVNCHGFRWCRS